MTRSSILCIDVGNSRVKWGLVVPGKQQWCETGVTDLAGLSVLVSELAQNEKLGSIVCSAVAKRSEIEGLLAMLEHEHQTQSYFIEASDSRWSSLNSYSMPEKLGVDRILAMYGAQSEYQHFAVIDAGTAITLDVVDGTKGHQGGVIMPGRRLLQESLCHKTDQIKVDQGRVNVLARNTEDAVSTGVVRMVIGGIESSAEKINQLYPGLVWLITGGDAEWIIENSHMSLVMKENLVLEGVGRVARELYA